MCDYKTDECCKITDLNPRECAQIIDELLSSRDVVETQDIYDELEHQYKFVEKKNRPSQSYKETWKHSDRKIYEDACTECYGSICKQAIQALYMEIRRKELNPKKILSVVPCDYNRDKYAYRYFQRGFSVFAIENHKSSTTTNAIALVMKNAAKILEGQIGKGTDEVSPKDIERAAQDLINIINQLKDDTIDIAFTTYIERLSRLKIERPNNWITSFLELVGQVINEFHSLKPSLAYADLLIEYADFIINYNFPKDRLPENINCDIVDFAQDMYMGAISKALENNNKPKQISYLIKYSEFLFNTFQYDILYNVLRKVIKLCESIRDISNIEKEYASALNLYANYLWRIDKVIEAEAYFKKALNIRAKIAGYDVDTLEKVVENRPHLEDLFLLSTTIQNLAYVYMYLYPNSVSKECQRLFQHCLEIRKECANRNPKIYRVNLASAYYNLGNLYIFTLEYDRALRNFEKALTIDKTLVIKYPEVHKYVINYSNCLERISALYLWIHKDYIKAEEAALDVVDKIETLYEYNPQTFELLYAEKLYWLSIIYDGTGKYDEALDSSLRALNVFENSNMCSDTSKVKVVYIKRLIAEIYAKKTMYTEADMFSSEALIMAERLHRGTKQSFNHYKLALQTRVSILQEMSDYNAAETVVCKGIELMKSHYSNLNESQMLDIFEIKKEVAQIYRNYKKEYDKALAIYEEIRTDFIKHFEGSIAYADFLLEYALCYYDAKLQQKCKEMLNDAILQYDSIVDQNLMVKEKKGITHLYLALALTVDENYEESFKSYEQSINLLNKVYKSEPLSVGGYLAMAHRYYGLALEGSDKVKSLEQYNCAFDYYIELCEDANEINNVISELKSVISAIPKYVDKNIIDNTKKLVSRYKQREGIGYIESIEELEKILQDL